MQARAKAFTRLAQTTLTALAISASSSAIAQSSERWQGEWSTNHGQLELIQDGRFVYGDYRTDATFEGVTDPTGRVLRATFTYKDGRKGFATLIIASSNRFSGRWDWANQPPPRTGNDGRGSWSGTKKGAVRPRVTHFSYSPNPLNYWRRTTSRNRSWAFYDGGYRAIARSSNNASTQSVGSASRPQRLSHIPAFGSLPAGYRPRYVEFRVREIDMSERGSLIGTMGVYAYCERTSGLAPLRVFGARPNRVFDRDRNSPRTNNISLRENQGARRFLVDRACLEDRNARIKFELKTNLTNHRRVGRDTIFGYQAASVYLDQMPRAGRSRSDLGFSMASSVSGQWNWDLWMAQDKRLVAKLLNPVMSIEGSIKFVD
ncbi:MAG: hypothetical protein AAGI28_01120 [Pseudomonadota bacterium]